MLNEERIRLMTRLAIYEEGEGKVSIPMSKYYKSDYISIQMIKTFLATTVSYILMIGIWVIYRMEELLEEIYIMDLQGLGIKLIAGYGAFLVLFLIITYLWAFVRYNKNKKGLKRYHSYLKKVSRFHESEEQFNSPKEWD